MFKKIWLYILAVRLMKEINNSGLQQLKYMDISMFSIISTFSRTSKPIQNLEQTFVQKVLLLATGIDDVVSVLDHLETPSLKYLIVDKYSEKTRFVSHIITLLPYLMKNIPSKDFFDLRGYELENTMVKRAQALIAADKRQSSSDSAIALICTMAEIVEDPSENGAGSQSAENILISMALPKIKYNLPAAIKIAESFRLKSSTHRFMLAFLTANGIASSRMANEITNTIRSCYFFGDELARKIIRLSNESGLRLGWELEERLEKISQQKLDDVDLMDVFYFDDLLGILKTETHNHPSIHSRETGVLLYDFPGKDSVSIIGEFPLSLKRSRPIEIEQIHSMMSIIGKVHDFIPDAHFIRGISITPQGIHPDMLVMDVRCDIGIRKIGGSDKAEAIKSVEEILREYEAAGMLDKITIHHMPVDSFVETYRDELSTEVVELVREALTA